MRCTITIWNEQDSCWTNRFTRTPTWFWGKMRTWWPVARLYSSSSPGQGQHVKTSRPGGGPGGHQMLPSHVRKTQMRSTAPWWLHGWLKVLTYSVRAFVTSSWLTLSCTSARSWVVPQRLKAAGTHTQKYSRHEVLTEWGLAGSWWRRCTCTFSGTSWGLWVGRLCPGAPEVPGSGTSYSLSPSCGDPTWIPPCSTQNLNNF